MFDRVGDWVSHFVSTDTFGSFTLDFFFGCLKCSKMFANVAKIIQIITGWRAKKISRTFYRLNRQSKDIYHVKCYRTSCKWYSYELRLCLFIGPVLQQHTHTHTKPFTIHAVFRYYYFFSFAKIFKKAFLNK